MFFIKESLVNIVRFLNINSAFQAVPLILNFHIKAQSSRLFWSILGWISIILPLSHLLTLLFFTVIISYRLCGFMFVFLNVKY